MARTILWPIYNTKINNLGFKEQAFLRFAVFFAFISRICIKYSTFVFDKIFQMALHFLLFMITWKGINERRESLVNVTSEREAFAQSAYDD